MIKIVEISEKYKKEFMELKLKYINSLRESLNRNNDAVKLEPLTVEEVGDYEINEYSDIAKNKTQMFIALDDKKPVGFVSIFDKSSIIEIFYINVNAQKALEKYANKIINKN